MDFYPVTTTHQQPSASFDQYPVLEEFHNMTPAAKEKLSPTQIQSIVRTTGEMLQGDGTAEQKKECFIDLFTFSTHLAEGKSKKVLSDEIVTLSRNGAFRNLDLRNTKLRSLDLAHLDLTYTDLTDSDLSNSCLIGSDLSHCNLAHSNLINTQLQFAILKNANINLSQEQIQSFVRLAGKILKGDGSAEQKKQCFINLFTLRTYLVEEKSKKVLSEEIFTLSRNGAFRNLDLKNIRLPLLDLTNLDLTDTDLTESDLTESCLIGSDLSNCNLYRSNLINAQLQFAILKKANLSWAAAQGANMSHVNLSEANLSYLDLSTTTLDNAVLTNANGYSAIFNIVMRDKVICDQVKNREFAILFYGKIPTPANNKQIEVVLWSSGPMPKYLVSDRFGGKSLNF